MQTLPTDAADLTATWVSEALGTEVTDVELLDHAFATNQRARIGLTYATADAGPPTLFVKLAPLDPVHRQMIGAIGMGDREAQFYADVAPTIDLLVPRSYFGASDDDNAFVLLLEDLGARGCQFASNGEWGVSADGGAVALEQLARFHARFEDGAERARVAPWLSTTSQSMSEATSGLMRMVLDAQAEQLSENYSAIGELYVEHHAWFDEIWHAGPATYIHGDTHIGNVYLDDGQVGFLDWGLSRVSTHLRDVSYFMTMSIDIEERRAHERELLQGYLDALRAAGGVDITFDDAWAAHRLHASYTVVATFLAYMPSYAASDGVGLGNALLARSDAALADLDVVEAVRTALAI